MDKPIDYAALAAGVREHIRFRENSVPRVPSVAELREWADAFDKITAAQQQGQAVAWRCFHCDEVFTDQESAAEHFGTKLRHDPACTIDPAEFRRLQDRETDYAAEDAAVHRAMARMETEHRLAMEREEIKGYERGLRDSGKCPCAAPQPTQQGGGEVVAYQWREDSALNGRWGPWAECSHDEYAALARILSGRMEARIAGRLERGDLREDAAGWPTQIRALCVAAPPSAPVGVEAVRYDAGLLSDYGGGNVEWWQDYIRAELERAHDFYTDALAQQPAAVECPKPRNRAEAAALARIALAHLGVIDAHIEAAIARCETDLATQHQEPTT